MPRIRVGTIDNSTAAVAPRGIRAADQPRRFGSVAPFPGSAEIGAPDTFRNPGRDCFHDPGWAVEAESDTVPAESRDRAEHFTL